MKCPCGNAATVAGRCEWCAGHDDCAVPVGVSISQAWFSGTPVARCLLCGWTCAYWGCACDLDHECLAGSCDWCDEPHDLSDCEDHCADCGTCWEHCEQGHGVMLDGRGSWGPRVGVAS